jgi:hypothetical protein
MMLSEEVRTHDAKFCFLVWCTWRLERGKSVVVSSDGAESDIVAGMERLIGENLL